MDTSTLKRSDEKRMVYKDKKYGDFISNLEVTFKASKKEPGTDHLICFNGPYDPDKEIALNKISARINRSVRSVDVAELITPYDKESRENLDDLFENAKPHSEILYLWRGEYFCGMFTGHTLSKVRYATPHERYFLRKMHNYDGPVVISFSDYDYMDETMMRASWKVIEFPLPGNFFKRFIWQAKNYTLHGFRAF